MVDVAQTGYWTNGDAYGWSLGLAEWISNFLGSDKSVPVWDLGCGPGSYLSILQRDGFEHLVGFEGAPLPDDKRLFSDIRSQDISKPFDVPTPGHVIFLEVAEHVPAEYEVETLDNVAAACAVGCKLVMSWARRGQPGIGHVNCKEESEVIPKLEARGFKFLPTETERARRQGHGFCPWFAATAMVFERVRETRRHFWRDVNGFCTFPEFYAWAAGQMPKIGARIVELGVAYGQSLAVLGVELLNQGCADAKIDMVDLGDEATVRRNLAPVADLLGTYHQRNSWDVAEQYADGSLDMVFVDANHSRECVAKDIAAWRRKVKPGGIIAGHDHTTEIPGVIEAVTDSFERYDVWRGIKFHGSGRYYPVWCVRIGDGGEESRRT